MVKRVRWRSAMLAAPCTRQAYGAFALAKGGDELSLLRYKPFSTPANVLQLHILLILLNG
jgi:hypothetical protein